MSHKIHNIRFNLFLTINLILASFRAIALTIDNQQPIYVNSTTQKVDMKTNTVTLTGDVLIRRGSINIHANKLIITCIGDKNGNEVLEGYGNPITFYQLQDNGEPVRSHSQKIRYEITNDIIILSGNAYLERLDSNVKGDHIIYLFKKQQIEAFSDKNKQVITVLVPTTLQYKKISKFPTRASE